MWNRKWIKSQGWKQSHPFLKGNEEKHNQIPWRIVYDIFCKDQKEITEIVTLANNFSEKYMVPVWVAMLLFLVRGANRQSVRKSITNASIPLKYNSRKLCRHSIQHHHQEASSSTLRLQQNITSGTSYKFRKIKT